MATVIDALVVTLGLDAKGFKKGTEETEKSLKATASASVRFAKEMEASGKQAAQVFSAIKMEALGLIGVLSGTAGLGAVAFNASKAMADLGRQAAAMNMPVDQLDAFGKAVALAGGNSATARGQLQSLADFMAESKMHGGNAEKLGYFAAIGADPWQDTPLDVMMKAADYAKTHDLLTAKTQLGKIGLGDDAMLNFLKGGSAGLRSGMNESRRIGVITPEMSKNAAELQKAFVGLGLALGISKDKWLNDWSPAATSMLNWTKEMVINNPPLVKGILDLGVALALLGSVGAATGLARLFGLFSLARGGVSAATGLAAMVAPLAAITGVVTQHGDTMDPENKGTQGPGGELFGSNGPIAKWWNGLGSNSPASSKGRPDQHGTREQTIKYFMDRGWREDHAAGIADTISAESGYNAAAYNPAGCGQGARGAIQWRGDRIDQYRKMFGHTPEEGSYEENMRFVHWELTQGDEQKAGKALRGAWNEKDAADRLNKMYTRPGHPYVGKQSSLTGGNTSTVAINTINVHTAATDATGIAASIKGAIANSFMAQANPGYA